MSEPKISVPVPMYNRKHCIAEAVDSLLNQTFQDFEIVVRDDGSTDGSADFVEEKYADEISLGRIKLRRNEKNIGEFFTDNKLLREAIGKYIMILHSDDAYVPDALERRYTLAEKYNADMVHCSAQFATPQTGSLKKETLRLVHHDKKRVDKVTLVPNNPMVRVNTYLNDFFVDMPHNILKRRFVIDNDLSFQYGNGLLLLKCLMKADVVVKTPPQPFYIYRRSSYSDTNSSFPPERVAKFIEERIKYLRCYDDFFAQEEFFQEHKDLQYRLKCRMLANMDLYRLKRKKVYKDGVTPELHRAVEEVFKKYFGEDSFYLTFLFHWIHCRQFDKNVRYIHRNIPPPESSVRG